MGPVHGAIINWFAHKYGYVNFKVNDTAKNLLPFDFLMMGESYHNNHHKFGGRANFGIRWFELDPTFPIILLLNFMVIIQLKAGNDLKVFWSGPDSAHTFRAHPQKIGQIFLRHFLKQVWPLFD